jgi:hypothetical protein
MSRLFEQNLEVIHRPVAVDPYLGPGETAAIDDAGVVELIANDQVPYADEGGEQAAICHVTSIQN